MSHEQLDVAAVKLEPEHALTETLQCNAQPSSASENNDIDSTIDHSSTLSFPTLDADGSLPDLRAVPTHRYSTPPAALSSLGAKARMAYANSMSDSTDSLADAQYDMMDDISETSNDDRETASLASSEHRDSDVEQLTPDDTGSIVDLQEEQERASAQQYGNISGSFETLMDQMSVVDQKKFAIDQKFKLDADRAADENELMDSYLSEDLETPRQSTLPATFEGPSSHRRTATESTASPITANAAGDDGNSTLRILFVSERGISDDVLTSVCQRIASCVAHTTEAGEIIKQPPTPTGINPSCVLMLRNGDVKLTAQHCVDAKIRGCGSFDLHIQDADNEHSSIFTVGKDQKIELEKPDLVVFYLDKTNSYPSWFNTVKDAMAVVKVPNMTVGGLAFDLDLLTDEQLENTSDSDIVVDNKMFYAEDGDIRGQLDSVLHPKATTKSSNVANLGRKAVNDKKSIKKLVWQGLKKTRMIWLMLILSMLPPLLLTLIFPSLRTAPSLSPVAELAARRDALSTILMNMTNTTNVTDLFNMEHLLPSAASPFSRANFQGAPPNHIVVSLRKETGSATFPYVTSARVTKSDVYKSRHRDIPANITRLIDGVYDVSIVEQEAHGLVNVMMLTNNPGQNVTVEHNFRSKLWQLRTYEKASTDLTKAATKDVALARQRCHSLSSKMEGKLSVSAAAAATKNMTSQLAVYVTRDLQVFRNTALSMADRAARSSKVAAQALKVDFQHSLSELHQDIKAISKVTADSAKALIPTKNGIKKTATAPFALSRKRAMGFKDVIAGGKKATNSTSTSATTELSLYVQNLLNPSEKTKKAGSLSDIARCVRAQDYKACRKAQKVKAYYVVPTASSSAAAVRKSSTDDVYKACQEQKDRVTRLSREMFARIYPDFSYPQKLSRQQKAVLKHTEAVVQKLDDEASAAADKALEAAKKEGPPSEGRLG